MSTLRYNDIQSLEIFSGISEEKVTAFLQITHVEYFKAGETIIQEGDESNAKAYIIVEGVAEIYIENALVGTLERGDIFGEYALISAENRTATVQAKTNLECLIMDEASILAFIDESDTINRTMMQRIKDNIRNQHGVFKDL